MQVDRHHPVSAGDGQHVGEQPGADRLAGARLAVLARVAVVGNDRDDALGRGPLCGVDEQQLLPDAVVDRRAVGLHDEHVAAADVLAVPHVDLAVGELVDVHVAQAHAQVVGHLPSQLGVAPAGEDLHPLLGDDLHGSVP